MPLVRPLMVLLVGWSVSVAAPATEPPLQQVEHEIDRMRKHLSAVSARFEGGMKVARPSDDPERARTPAMQCCVANLRGAGDRLVGFNRALLKLSACYQGLGDAEGEAHAQRLRTQAESLRRGLQEFVNAPTRAGARGALAGTTRAFLQLDRDRRELRPCETPTLEPPVSDPSDP